MKTMENREVLESRIIHLAHIVDKNLNAFPEQRENLKMQFAASLEKSLDQWAHRGFLIGERIVWAREILCRLNCESKVESESPHTQETTAKIDASVRLLIALISSRRTIRRWKAQDVPSSAIHHILEAARWAPSSGNRQAVRLAVINSPEAKAAVVNMKEKFLSNAPLIILVGLDLRVYGETERRTGLPYLDAAAAIQNMLLVAHVQGLGCCWSKLCEDDWKAHPELYFQMKNRLSLPSYFRPVSLIAIGWPSSIGKPPPRKETNEFVRFNDEGFPEDDFADWKPNRLNQLLSSCLQCTILNMHRSVYAVVHKLYCAIQRRRIVRCV